MNEDDGASENKWKDMRMYLKKLLILKNLQKHWKNSTNKNLQLKS